MHSKPKLALAVLTSPTAAFEEINSRDLLGTAFIIVAITGLIAMIGSIAQGMVAGPLLFFSLGKSNPVSWFGLYFLFALIVNSLLNLMGTPIEYKKVLLVMGWAQVTLLLGEVAKATVGIWAVFGEPNSSAANILSTAYLGFHIWYIAAVGFGIAAASGAAFSRGAITYVGVEALALIAFNITYGKSQLAPFESGLPGLKKMAESIVAVDQMPWIAAAVIGLAIGLWKLGKNLNWTKAITQTAIAAAILFGGFGLGYYINLYAGSNNYNIALKAQRMYDKGKYAETARLLEQLMKQTKDDKTLLQDLSNVFYLAGNTDKSIFYSKKFLKLVKEAKIPKSQKNQWLAQIYSEMGMVYDADGDYEKALMYFDKSAKALPKFRDPWVRKAITYNRMGQYDKAIEAGNHAMKKLDSDAQVGWVALAQAYAQTNDLKQAKAAAALAMEGENTKLAKRLGKSPKEWKTAVSRLTREDLLFPMEKEPVMPAKESKKKN